MCLVIDIYAIFVHICTDADIFTLKLNHGCVMLNNPKRYEKGVIDYVDFCNAGEFSLLEIYCLVRIVCRRGLNTNCTIKLNLFGSFNFDV